MSSARDGQLRRIRIQAAAEDRERARKEIKAAKRRGDVAAMVEAMMIASAARAYLRHALRREVMQ